MNRQQIAFAIVGALTTAFGLALLFTPNTVLIDPVEMLVEGVETTGQGPVLLLTGIGVIAYLGIALRPTENETESGQATRRFEQYIEQPPGTIPEDDRRLTASDLDEEITEAIENGGESLVVLRRRLRTTAASVYADVMNTQTASAQTVVDQGEWCRDPVAAAFLAGSAGPSTPLQGKLRMFLLPRRERRRRIERTITAIEQLEYE